MPDWVYLLGTFAVIACSLGFYVYKAQPPADEWDEFNKPRWPET